MDQAVLTQERCIPSPGITCESFSLESNTLRVALTGEFENANEVIATATHQGETVECSGTVVFRCSFESAEQGVYELSLEYTPRGSQFPRSGTVDILVE